MSTESAGGRKLRYSGNAWIAWLGRRSGFVLVLATLLSALSLWCFAHYGALNSDLSKLIRPSESLSWYRDNERYKAAFPQFQQSAVIVARSDDYRQLQGYVRELAGRLPMDTVFAPGVDPFVAAAKPYFLSLPQLQEWLNGASYNQGSLLRLMDEATLANALFTYADFVSANPGQVLPISLESLVDGLADQDLVFQSYYPLEPEGGGHIELILVSAEQRLDAALPNAEIVSALQLAIEGYPAPEGVEVALTGEVVLAHEEMSAALSGIERAGLISLFFLLCIVSLGIRSGPILLAISIMLAMGVSLTLGFATLVVGELNALSMIFVVLFFGLGVDFAAHFTLRVQANLDQKIGVALGLALRDTGPALALCTVTSAVSFLAFLPTAYRGLAELGVISASGIVIAFVLTLSIIPALLLRWPPVRPDPIGKVGLAVLFHPIRSRIDALRGPWVVGMFAAVSLASLWVAKDLRFDYSVLAMRDAQSPAMQALLALQQDQQTTDYSVHVLADDADEAAQLKEELLRLPSVSAVSTPADFVPTEQAKKAALLVEQSVLLEEISAPERNRASDAELTALALEYLQQVIPELPNGAADAARQVLESAQNLARAPAKLEAFEQQMFQQYSSSLAEYRRLLTFEPFALDDVPAHFRQQLIAQSGQHLVSVNPSSQLNDRDATDTFIAQVSAVAPNVAGRSVVEWGVGGVVIQSFQQAVATAFLIIFLVLVCYFRGWKLPLLVFIPIGVTVILTFALCVALKISLNMANILMVPLILGLGVDTGIHIVHRHTQGQVAGDTMDPAIRRAVMISGLTTIGTFCSLSFSPHLGAASIGIILSIAISVLLVTSLLLMPILLRWFAVDQAST